MVPLLYEEPRKLYEIKHKCEGFLDTFKLPPMLFPNVTYHSR